MQEISEETATRGIDCGSTFSGSEFCIRATKELLNAICDRFKVRRVKVNDKMACELEAWNGEFILDHGAPDFLFDNAKVLSGVEAFCHRLKAKRKVPRVQWLHYGFSCRRLSGLFNDRADYQCAIAFRQGCTCSSKRLGMVCAIIAVSSAILVL